MATPERETAVFLVRFTFRSSPPGAEIRREYARLDVLRAEGVFEALDLLPDRSGGTLTMRGSRAEVDAAVRSLPLHPYAEWIITEA